MPGLRSHDPVDLTEAFNYGLHSRPGDIVDQPARLIQAENVIYGEGAVGLRPGFSEDTVGLPANTVRLQSFSIAGSNAYYIALDNIGQFWIKVPAGAYVNHFTEATAADFDAIVMFDKLYIAPNDGGNGTSLTLNLYVYKGSGTARKAGGAAPVPGAFAVAAGGAGNVEKGQHLIAVAFEYDTGYITPGGTNYTLIVAAGGTAFTPTNVPLGPAGVVARHILMSKVIPFYDGNQLNYELFFCAKINDNTTVNPGANFINKFDSELVSSADYLLNQRTTIPSGLKLTSYKGRLIISNILQTPHLTDDFSTALVSKAGFPESFDSTNGFIIVNPELGVSIQSAAEYGTSLYFFKRGVTYGTTDNGLAPNTWDVPLIDAGKGALNSRSISNISTGGPIQRQLLVATDSGVFQFYGSYSDEPLTYKIESLYAAAVQNVLVGAPDSFCVALDVVDKDIYVLGKIEIADTFKTILVGNYKRGLDSKNIRWSVWTVNLGSGKINLLGLYCDRPTNANQITLTIFDASKRHMVTPSVFISSDGSLQPGNQDISAGLLKPITGFFKTSYSSYNNSVRGQNHFNAIRGHIYGQGNLVLTLDGPIPPVAPTINVTIPSAASNSPNRTLLINYISERLSIKVSMVQRASPTGILDTFVINQLAVFVKPLWMSVPQ